jgi:uncharacterized membrane protein
MESNKTLILINILFLVFIWFITVTSYDSMPIRVPSHFDFDGQPTTWTDKSFLIFFIMPIISTLMVLAMIFLTRYPQYYSFPQRMQVKAWRPEKRQPVYDFIGRMMLFSALIINLTFLLVQYTIIEGAEYGVLPVSRMWLILASIFLWLPLLVYMFYRLNKIVEGIKKSIPPVY